jgi:hypothetical protein
VCDVLCIFPTLFQDVKQLTKGAKHLCSGPVRVVGSTITYQGRHIRGKLRAEVALFLNAHPENNREGSMMRT